MDRENAVGDSAVTVLSRSCDFTRGDHIPFGAPIASLLISIADAPCDWLSQVRAEK